MAVLVVKQQETGHGEFLPTRLFRNYREQPVVHHCALAKTDDQWFNCPFNPGYVLDLFGTAGDHIEARCWAMLVEV